MRVASIVLALVLSWPVAADISVGGHAKILGQYDLEQPRSQHQTTARINVEAKQQHWSLQLHGEMQQCSNELDCDQWRFDRANVFWQQDNFQITFGRHAISWGNGLIFNPVDVFNPFNPLAIDTEYKPGADMAHLQYALDNGDDVQFLWVDHMSHSSAVKYHHFANQWEWDVIVADHAEDNMFALGTSRALGEWLWRGEWVRQKNHHGLVAQHWVTNLQRFFDLAGEPAGLTLEWFHNGWGIDDESSQAARIELLTRLARGELFTPGKDYIALSLHRQMHPLWQLGVTHISEAHNDSHISQIFSNVDLSEALQLRLAVALPWKNSRQLDAPIPRSLMAQFAWYF